MWRITATGGRLCCQEFRGLELVREQVGSPAWIRTTIHGSKGRCPTIRRPGIAANATVSSVYPLAPEPAMAPGRRRRLCACHPPLHRPPAWPNIGKQHTAEVRMAVRSFFLGMAASALAVAATIPSQPTFYKDVLPVMQNRCQECHRPGEAAPMSFLTYKEARPWAKAIREAVITRKMPPWPADPHFGKFSNDRSLSREEIDTLVAWADAGAREGDSAEAPKPGALRGRLGHPQARRRLRDAQRIRRARPPARSIINTS